MRIFHKLQQIECFNYGPIYNVHPLANTQAALSPQHFMVIRNQVKVEPDYELQRVNGIFLRVWGDDDYILCLFSEWNCLRVSYSHSPTHTQPVLQLYLVLPGTRSTCSTIATSKWFYNRSIYAFICAVYRLCGSTSLSHMLNINSPLVSPQPQTTESFATAWEQEVSAQSWHLWPWMEQYPAYLFYPKWNMIKLADETI